MWDQTCYYNADCPEDTQVGITYCDHVPAGCVAVSSKISINTSELEDGLYILQIISDKGVETRKIQISK